MLVQLARVPSDEPNPAYEISAPPTSAERIAVAVAEPAAPTAETPAAAKQRELEAMSETFRNTTFLIAIRDAGFVCNELLRVAGGLDGSTKWLATCSEMLAYTLGVTNDGKLGVAPMMQYFDGVHWTPQQDFGSTELVRPPQAIPQSEPPPR
jgi:hypothetical protein